MEFVKSNKLLFLWSAILIIAALALKYVHLPKVMTQFVGLFEVILAVITGIAFGWKTTQMHQ